MKARKLISFALALLLMLVTLTTMVYAKEISVVVVQEDEIAIKELITALFDVKRSQLENPSGEDFDFSVFWDTDAHANENLTIFERNVLVDKGIFAAFDAYAANASTELHFESIEIDENTAAAEVYEWMTYTYCSSARGMNSYESGTGIAYTITLVKNDYEWLISDVVFYTENEDVLKDTTVSVDMLIADAYETATTCTASEVVFDTQVGNTVSPNVFELQEMDLDRFVGYARVYGGTARNSNFPDFSNYGGDCQNFASQCIWYAFGGINSASNIASYGNPMVSPSDTSEYWCQWYCNKVAHSPSWSGVDEFYTHIKYDGTDIYGVWATVYSGIANAQVGDIIQIQPSGSSSWTHSYVVVAVTGTSGSRTASDITVSAHTTDRDRVLLSSISLGGYSFRTIRVFGIFDAS